MSKRGRRSRAVGRSHESTPPDDAQTTGDRSVLARTTGAAPSLGGERPRPGPTPGKRQLRLECEQNQYLSSVIPILYGALLSYAMYVFASLLLDLFQYYGTLDLADSGLPRKGISLREFLPTASLFLLFTFFVVEDLGEIVKLSQIYPLRRTSRYSHEVVIAGLLLGGYAFLGVRSILAVVLFGTAIGWGGIWCNQLTGC